MYCLSAMEIFDREGPEARQRITFEIALLGRSGLDINDAAPKYSLSSLPSAFLLLPLQVTMNRLKIRFGPPARGGILPSASSGPGGRRRQGFSGCARFSFALSTGRTGQQAAPHFR